MSIPPKFLEEQLMQLRGERLKLEGGGRCLVPASNLSI